MNHASLRSRCLRDAAPASAETGLDGVDPAAIVAAVPTELDVIWLDSGAEDHQDPAVRSRARWSIVGFADGPFGAALVHADRRAVVTVQPAAERWFGSIGRSSSGIFDSLAAVVAAAPRIADGGVDAQPAIPDCPFALGWVGYLGYECGREGDGPDRSASTPDLSLRFIDRAIIVDHLRGSVWGLTLAVDAEPEATRANERWLASLPDPLDIARVSVSEEGRRGAVLDGGRHGAVRLERSAATATPMAIGSVRRTEYERAVEVCRSEIRSGSAFQVCLTTSFHLESGQEASSASGANSDPNPDPNPNPNADADADADPIDAALADYLRMRDGAPVPFGAYVRLGSVRLASRSPERFLRVDPDGSVMAEPIKGTSARSDDPRTDAARRAALAMNAKERAENVMIVDLVRNDVQRSALPGSVTVERLCAVETYPTVHQLVSTVVGTRLPNLTSIDVVRNAFPPGSMTGAPKPSAMAIIDRLEGAPRGPYAGALGYFSLSGHVDLAVAIRTLVTVVDAQGVVVTRSLGAGGAITWPSDAAAEAEEVVGKTASVLGPLGYAVSW
ncbi:anthranilate synthase component I family protein [Curtobacterium ammoniigenes]|uniref:anthranilate synthase component I family protein n=1 Tax=Curtobacterium ammoniigenes TaxID=395387 RepID=UPI000A9DE25F|nr:anthranilate synthase component I family protein [Curtobacterium ammoniigenes]